MGSLLPHVLLILPILDCVISITLEDVYKRLLEKERHIDETFASQFIRPVGTVGGELIWPRSYEKPSFLIFDNNGAAYNVASNRPTLADILDRTSSSLGASFGNNEQ